MGYPLNLFPPSRPGRLIVSVREASSWLDRRQFAGLPWHIYKGDRYWVSPDRGARRRSLSPRHNPRLADGRFALFLAEAHNVGLTDEVVGSFAVWLESEDDEGATARFGCFEVINEPEVAETLIDAAEVWLLERFPVMAIRGPHPLDNRCAPGLLTDGFNVRPPALMPYNPPYYPEMLERAGYEPSSGAQAFLLPAQTAQAAGARVVTPHRDPDAWDALAAFCGEATPVDAAVGVILEAHGAVVAGMAMAPDPARREWIGRLGRRGTKRLWARPSVTDAETGDPDALRELYAAAAGAARASGYAQVIVAPVENEDEANLCALAAAGAHPVQMVQVYEKQF
jgi:hypothetical protein